MKRKEFESTPPWTWVVFDDGYLATIGKKHFKVYYAFLFYKITSSGLPLFSVVLDLSGNSGSMIESMSGDKEIRKGSYSPGRVKGGSSDFVSHLRKATDKESEILDSVLINYGVMIDRDLPEISVPTGFDQEDLRKDLLENYLIKLND